MLYNEKELAYLLQQISEGNSSCFECLYKHYFKKCFAIALYYVKLPMAAEDVVADVYLNLWNKRSVLKEVRDWESFLFISIKNQSMNYLLKNQQHDMVSYDLLDLNLESGELTPEEEILRKEFDFLLTEAMNQLPEKTRLVYYMVREEKMSYKQIGESLNISERTVNSHMTTAVRKLVDSLREYFLQEKQKE